MDVGTTGERPINRTHEKPQEKKQSLVRTLLPNPVQEKKDQPADAPPAVPRGDDADRHNGGDYPGYAQDTLPGLL